MINKHIHILGISGTFMGGLAILAKQMGQGNWFRSQYISTNEYFFARKSN